MAYNQYNAPRQPDKDRLPTDELLQVLFTMKVEQRMSDTNLAKWLMTDSGYNYGRTYAYSLIKDTNSLVREYRRGLNTFTLEDVLSDLDEQKQGAIERGDNRLAFDIQKEINKVSGHYKERIEVNGDMTFKVKWGN